MAIIQDSKNHSRVIDAAYDVLLGKEDLNRLTSNTIFTCSQILKTEDVAYGYANSVRVLYWNFGIDTASDFNNSSSTERNGNGRLKTREVPVVLQLNSNIDLITIENLVSGTTIHKATISELVREGMVNANPKLQIAKTIVFDRVHITSFDVNYENNTLLMTFAYETVKFAHSTFNKDGVNTGQHVTKIDTTLGSSSGNANIK